MTITEDKTLVFPDVWNGETYKMPLKELRGVNMYVTDTCVAIYLIIFVDKEYEVSKEDYDWCVDYLNRKITKNE